MKVFELFICINVIGLIACNDDGNSKNLQTVASNIIIQNDSSLEFFLKSNGRVAQMAIYPCCVQHLDEILNKIEPESLTSLSIIGDTILADSNYNFPNLRYLDVWGPAVIDIRGQLTLRDTIETVIIRSSMDVVMNWLDGKIIGQLIASFDGPSLPKYIPALEGVDNLSISCDSLCVVGEFLRLPKTKFNLNINSTCLCSSYDSAQRHSFAQSIKKIVDYTGVGHITCDYAPNIEDCYKSGE